MELTQAETELIELIRGGDAGNFSVLIVELEGHWAVVTTENDSDGTKIGEGKGRGLSFDRAWNDLCDTALREDKPSPHRLV